MSEAAAVETLRPPRRTQAQRRATTRARLLDAAVDCLAEFGYQGTTLPDVARRAGLSNDPQAGRTFSDAMARFVGPELATDANFERGMRLLGVSLYGVALTSSLRTPAADLRLRAEIRDVLEMLFGLTEQSAGGDH